jgi:hypothetical protein
MRIAPHRWVAPGRGIVWSVGDDRRDDGGKDEGLDTIFLVPPAGRASRACSAPPWPASASATTGSAALGLPRGELAELARALSAPLPDADDVAKKAAAAWKALTTVRVRRPGLAELVPADTRPEAMSWDEVTQLVLALEALAPEDREVRDAVKPLRSALAFPPTYASPENFRRDADLDRALTELLRVLRR